MRCAAVVLLVLLAGCDKAEEEDTAGLEHPYTLARLAAEATLIAEGTLEQPDFQKNQIVLSIRGSLKGAVPPPKVHLEIQSSYRPYQEALRRHLLAPGTPAILFQSGSMFVLFVNRFFVSGYGGLTGGHAMGVVTVTERWLTRAFNGDTRALADTTRGILAGTTPTPPYDDQRPLLTRKSLMELPVWGEPVDEAYLPKPFRK